MACLVVASCRKTEAPRATPAAPQVEFEVRKDFGAGPVRFAVELSSSSITTAESVKCRLTLSVAKDYEADFPDIAFPEDVPGSILTAFDEQTTTEGDHRVIRRDYELEPEYEGKLILPKMEVYSHRAGEVKEDVFETEPIEVTVKASRETPADFELKAMRGLVTVEQIEAQKRRTWPWILASVCVLVAGAVVIVYVARRPRRLPPPPPAHEVALKRLRELADRGFAVEAIEPFFVEVTGIVRDYIEQAFGMRAPEQTTEEFLGSLRTAGAVARHRDVLEPFLVAADEVKFACMRPDVGAMRRAFETAEGFVVETSRERIPVMVGARKDSLASETQGGAA